MNFANPSSIDLHNAQPAQLLLLAATLGRTDLTMSAISAGADLNALTPHPNDRTLSLTPLHAAVQNAHVDVTRALLAAGANLQTLDSVSRPPLSYLPPDRKDNPQLHDVFSAHFCQKAALHDSSAVSEAIAAGLDPATIDSPDLANTPLHWAASFGSAPAAQALLAAGAPVDPVNVAGNTPLFDAVLAGHLDVVRLLVNAAADLNYVHPDGRRVFDLDTTPPVSNYLTQFLHPSAPLTASPTPANSKLHPLAIRPSSSASASASASPLYTNHPHRNQPLVTPRAHDAAPYPPPLVRSAAPVPDRPPWANLLWPSPRRFLDAGDTFTLPPVLTVSADTACLPIARRFLQWLVQSPSLRDTDTTVRLIGGGHGGLGEPIAFSAAIFLRIDPHALEASDQAYTISIRDFGIDVIASDSPGLFYACSTLVNLITLSVSRSGDPLEALTLPTLTISDWPSVRNRALYLDISRKRIPSMDTLKNLVTFMSKQARINQLHLNISPNFDRLKGVSRESMYRHEDVIELSHWCADHFVELIPVLAKPTSPIADPNVVDNGPVPNGSRRNSKHTTDDNPDDEMLFDEFLPLFDSPQVNLGNSNQLPAGQVPDFGSLRELMRSLRCRGKRTLHLFGDAIQSVIADEKLRPSILPELPGRTVMILEASESDSYESLRDRCISFRRHGLVFYTCASSCLDNTITGRLSSCLSQIEETVTAAQDVGGIGVMLKDGSMLGNGAPLVFLKQSILAFGGASWNCNEIIPPGNVGPDSLLTQLMDLHVFMDRLDNGVLGNICATSSDLHNLAGDFGGNLLRMVMGAEEEESWARAVSSLGSEEVRKVLRRSERIESALIGYEGLAERVDVVELKASTMLLGIAAKIVASLKGGEEERTRHTANQKGSVSLGLLSDSRRSDLCNQILQAIETMREGWLLRYDKVGFLEAVDDACGRLLSELAHGMPYQGYLEERRVEEWIPVDY